jgi:hypothetical protein
MDAMDHHHPVAEEEEEALCVLPWACMVVGDNNLHLVLVKALGAEVAMEAVMVDLEATVAGLIVVEDVAVVVEDEADLIEVIGGSAMDREGLLVDTIDVEEEEMMVDVVGEDRKLRK